MRAECLDWLLIVGRGHLEQVLQAYIEHDNLHRPHRPFGLEPLTGFCTLRAAKAAREATAAPATV